MRPRSVTIRKAFTLAIRWLRRLYLTPERAVIGLLVLEGLLFLSEWGKWFEFNRHKGWTVLINVAVVLLALGMLTGWFSWAWLWRRKFQLGLRGMLLLVASTAVACGWLTNDIRRARELEALRGRVERRCYGGCFGRWNDTIAEKVDDWIESVLGASFVTGCESASFTDGEMDPFPLEQVERGKNISQAKRDIHKCVDLSRDALTSVHIYLPGEIAKEIQLLSRCPNLSQLSINAGEIDSRVLADIGTMNKLERLEITLKHEVDLSPLAKLPILEHLEICGKLTDDGLETISQIKSLTWLNIGQTDVTSEGLNHLAKLTQLELLDLAKTKVTSEGLKYLPVSLQCLTLDQCGLESNSHFGRLVQLRRLDMREAEISDQALANLPLKIEDLDLSNSRVTPKNLRHISRLSELRSLDLSNTFISDGVDEVLEDLPTSLEVLRLAGNRVTNDGVRRLTRLRKLRLLDLSNTLVTNDGLSYLGELPWLSNVNLDRTCISNPAALFQHPTLRNLRLRSTLIDDDSFRDILISTTIQDLDVSGTQLGDAGYAILKKCRNLRRISRLNTHVTKPHTDPFDPFK